MICFIYLFFFEKRMLMNIAICDDDKSFRDLLEKHLRNYFNDRNISLNIFQFPSGEKLLENQLLFDLVFWMLKWVILMELIQVKN